MRLSAGERVAAALRQCWRDPPPPLTAPADEHTITLLLESGAGALLARRLPHPELEEAHRYQRLLQRVTARSLRIALDALHAAGIEPLVAKGLAIAVRYSEPGLRAVGDIDLYVRSREHDAAARVVRQIAAPIDLHRGFALLDDRSEEELWRRARAIEIEGAPVRVLGEEDHLRYVALHLLAHGGWRPMWWCDLALLLERRSASFDWDCFSSGEPRRTAWARCALALVGSLLGAELGGVPCDRPPGALAGVVLAEWGRRPYYRAPLATHLGRPWTLPRALFRRFPNELEAAFILARPPGARFSSAARVAATAWRVIDAVQRSARRRSVAVGTTVWYPGPSR